MGRQVNFYMLANDLARFEEWLQSNNEVFFINSRLSTPEIQPLQTLAISKMGETPLMVYLARKSELSDLVIKVVSNQNYWKIDILRSPAVELMRCYYNENMVRRGRLYFQTGYYDSDGHWIEKPKEFLDWANSLLRWIRNHYQKDPEIDFYVGPSAREWISQKGGQLNH